MNPKEVEELIDIKIRIHEVRVGLISGIIGGVWLVANVWMFVAVMNQG